MVSNSSHIVTDLFPVIRVYKDGKVERLFGSQYVPPSPEDPITGVSSKDITISPEVSARLYLPKITDPNQRLPILVYIHGGGFCIESAFSFDHQRHINLLVSQAKVVAVSVEYRLAPEHPLPAAYEDCWAALQWVASHIDNSSMEREPWLVSHGNFNKLYVGGDSAGANIVHNVVLRAGAESLYGDVKILGAFLTQPYFWSSNLASKGCGNPRVETLATEIWMFAYPSAQRGIDNPMINPLADGAPSLARLGCSRLLVNVAEKDILRNGGILYVDAVKESGWKGEIELLEVEGKDHSFHIFNPEDKEAKIQMQVLASFLMY
ncbi:2-hydroxyisoflavanone dehydratase-like [Coffea eugenioides]|uniref:2-hydroxyisoflavanone dehydratase-like n=1 Tax=Coffea arabica TaxID=13443 RepID=A0A6P6X2R1_COFAR|nr:2-hydroxyisoflavanone dehydratase-like [Coffea arabica]XP_027167133.1 2-hydroxyisoflavanone dehydratase-like [Coffea eugenioides]